MRIGVGGDGTRTIEGARPLPRIEKTKGEIMAQKPPVANSCPAKTLTVGSEDEAFALLKRALHNELADQAYVLEFENWPVLTLRFVDTRSPLCHSALCRSL